jgi:CRP-like cAMP-binding protein
MASPIVALLRKMDLFADLSDDALVKIGKLLKEQKFAENEMIFAQDDQGDALYIVLQGRVRISSTDHFGRERVLAFYGPGEFFGDMAVLTDAARSATATASSDSRLLQLRKDDFNALVSSNVGVMRGMLRVMVERQTAMNTRISQEAGASAGDVRGLVSVVFAPRGGAGQTVLATNLAIALAETTPDRVVIVDLDLLFGHVAMLLDQVPRTSLAAITPAAIRAADRESFGYYLARHPESSLRLLVGTTRPEESELVTAEHVRAALDVLRRQFVHVIVDAGARFTEPTLAALEAADHVLIVSTPEPAAVEGAKQTHRVLRDLLNVSVERITYVLNQPSPYGGMSVREFGAQLESEWVHEVPFGGEEVSRAVLEGFPLVMGRSSNPASRAIVSLARKLERSSKETLALAGQA